MTKCPYLVHLYELLHQVLRDGISFPQLDLDKYTRINEIDSLSSVTSIYFMYSRFQDLSDAKREFLKRTK